MPHAVISPLPGQRRAPARFMLAGAALAAGLALLPPASARAEVIGVTAAEVSTDFGFAGPRQTRAEVLAALDRVCRSRVRADRRRCDAAWALIREAHARLEAERAEQLAR